MRHRTYHTGQSNRITRRQRHVAAPHFECETGRLLTWTRCGVDEQRLHPHLAELTRCRDGIGFRARSARQQRIRCRTDFDATFPASDQDAWFAEYANNVEDLGRLQSRSVLWTDLDEHARWDSRPGGSPDWREAFLEAPE